MLFGVNSRRSTGARHGTHSGISIVATFASHIGLAKLTAPITLGRLCQRRTQTVHVVAAITIVAEQKLVVIFRVAAHSAPLALDTQPLVLLDRVHDGRIEAETGGGMELLGALCARDESVTPVGLASRLLFNTKAHATLYLAICTCWK